MLKSVFKKLDDEIRKYNDEARSEGVPSLKKARIKVLGQTALIESKIDLDLFETKDVDAYIESEYWVKKKFDDLLKAKGLFFDPLSNEIWMPTETEFLEIYSGTYLEGSIAQPEYVLISKVLKAPSKNKALLVEYIAKGPSKIFLELARKYKIKLEDFV